MKISSPWLLLAAVIRVSAQTNKAVYAHFMVGIVERFTVEDWKVDIQQAKAIGIDGFALNCAPPRIDSYTPRQLANAYAAAQQLGNFKMFISFDFAYWSTGDVQLITDILNTYSTHPAQAYYNGGALVSTFVGDSMNWNQVRAGLGGKKITAIPMIQDPYYIPNAAANNGLDGAFSWYAWPTSGGNNIIPGPMTTQWDDRFLANLGDRPYMAPVSPWFFTHFPSKNWAFNSEVEPHLRWEQMLAMKPELIEIVSWNDFGESHYISGSQPNHSDDGSSQWTNGFPHDAWRSLYQPYIKAYKAGASAPTIEKDQVVYWYRPHLKDAPCSNDPLGRPRGAELYHDVVFVTTLLRSPGELIVTSGGKAPVTVQVPAGVRTTQIPLGTGRQQFSLRRNGAQILGGTSSKEVTNSCVTFNYNPFVGGFGL